MSPPATPDHQRRISRRRLWLFRIVALLFPLACIAGLEFGFRLAGVGYPTSFFVPVADRPGYLHDNYQFAWRFFPRALARTPQPSVVSREKPATVKRILVFGGSAAMGDPEPAYGLPRMLRVVLQERFPQFEFEVVNCAVTAINSHVVRHIASDSRAIDADAWVVYMGNNEVHGPFGAGTVFGARGRPLWLNQATLAFQRSSFGQWAVAMRGDGDSAVPQDWGGMKMFLDQRVRHDASELNAVYANLQHNLEAILSLGASQNVPVVVSTVVSNLRDFVPFVSVHRESLTQDEMQAWTAAYEEGIRRQAAGDFTGALAHFDEAAKIDATFAELQFRTGQCHLAGGDATAARECFVAARDYDALRFRADSRMNQMIRDVADQSNAQFVDAVEQFDRASPDGIVGNNLLHEHVHLNFQGNYELACLLADRLATCKGWATADGVAAGHPTVELCRERLVYSTFHEMQVKQEMRGRLAAPPFSDQSSFAQRDATLARELDGLARTLTPELGRSTLQQFDDALMRDPDDWMLRRQLAVLLDSIGDLPRAKAEFERIVQLIPHHAESHFRLGALCSRMKEYAAAEDSFRQAIDLRPDFARAWNSLGICLSHLDRFDESYSCFAEAVRLRSSFAEPYVNWGLVLANQDETASAMEKYRAALEVDANYVPAHQQLGRALFAADDFGSALPHFVAIANARPGDAAAHLELGLVCLRLPDQLEQARRSLQRALQLDPNNRLAVEALSRLPPP